VRAGRRRRDGQWRDAETLIYQRDKAARTAVVAVVVIALSSAHFTTFSRHPIYLAIAHLMSQHATVIYASAVKHGHEDVFLFGAYYAKGGLFDKSAKTMQQEREREKGGRGRENIQRCNFKSTLGMVGKVA